MRIFGLLACLILAACATPREACQRRATAELATLDRLIAETQGNLSRGYTLEREAYEVTVPISCWDDMDGFLFHRFDCTTTETRYRQVPKAVDLAAERRKLAQLQATRAQQARRAQVALAQCEAAYPAP